MSKAIVKQDPLKALLIKATPSVAAIMPPAYRIDAERLVRLALVSCEQNYQLKACSPESILSGVVQAGQLGLDLGGVTGHAYLVPMKGRAQMVPGYRGLVQLVWRAAKIDVSAFVVNKRDHFKVMLGTDQSVEHTPVFDDPGEAIAYYAVGRFPDGRCKFEVMSKAQTDAIMGRSQAAQGGFSPWTSDYDEMAKKTVAKRLCKYLPLASDTVAKAIEIDDRATQGNVTPLNDVIDIPADPPEQPDAAVERVRKRGKKAKPMTDEEKASIEAAEERAAIQGEGG